MRGLFSYLERGVLAGGCVFVAAGAELDAKPGPVRDHFLSVYTSLIHNFTALIVEAQQLGEIRASEDVAQLTFELDAFLLGANFAFVFFADPIALERARLAVRSRLDHARA